MPALADLVIADLARWKDWKIQPRLIEMYNQAEYPSVKRAIVRFILVSSRPEKPKSADKQVSVSKSSVPTPRLETPPEVTEASAKREVSGEPGEAADTEPAHVIQSRSYLATLRARDPEIVSDAERFFFVE